MSDYSRPFRTPKKMAIGIVAKAGLQARDKPIGGRRGMQKTLVERRSETVRLRQVCPMWHPKRDCSGERIARRTLLVHHP